MTQVQLSCQNVCMNYGNNLALNNVSFDVCRGDYICIVGENGSGKSTLLKGILGLISIKSGKVIFEDELKREKIGYLPQQTLASRDFPASVFEVVLSGCLGRRGGLPFYSKKEKDVALKNIRRLDVYDIKNKCYRDLSGGQQQRVLLARALCATQDILFLDEPITGLDPAMTSGFYQMIKMLNLEDGLTIIMASHDIHTAMHQADKILHLDSSVLFFGTAKDYANSDVSKKFLGGDHSGCV